jgi:hypothetical protein
VVARLTAVATSLSGDSRFTSVDVDGNRASHRLRPQDVGPGRNVLVDHRVWTAGSCSVARDQSVALGVEQGKAATLALCVQVGHQALVVGRIVHDAVDGQATNRDGATRDGQRARVRLRRTASNPGRKRRRPEVVVSRRLRRWTDGRNVLVERHAAVIASAPWYSTESP